MRWSTGVLAVAAATLAGAAAAQAAPTTATFTKTSAWGSGFVVSGAPCQATWGAYYGLDDPWLRDQIAGFRAAGGTPIVSFGGAANQELALTCSTVSALAAQYQAVIDATGSRDLDFDIEGAATSDAASLARRAQAIAQLQGAGAAAGRSGDLVGQPRRRVPGYDLTASSCSSRR